MALSRKRRKELKKLRSAATDLWGDQKDVLESATRIVQEAQRQAIKLNHEEVAPRVKYALDTKVVPAVETGIAGAKSIATSARTKLSHDIIPSVSTSLGSLLALAEVSKDPRVRDALANISTAGNKLGVKVGLVEPPKKSAGPVRFVVIGLGVIAFVGVAYAAWQTLRADDELWVTDDDDSAPEPVAQ